MKKAMGMFAALILALGMSGLAYAHWSQTIYIEGTVETGELVVGFVDYDYWDDEYLGKDVGDIYVDLVDWKGLHEEDDLYEKIVIELTDVYPSYEAWIEVSIANGGSIPVNLVDFDIENIIDPDGLMDYVDVQIINYDWPLYPQLDPCDTATALIYIHILQEVWDDGLGEWVTCPQNATATFDGYLTFNQWNWPGP